MGKTVTRVVVDRSGLVVQAEAVLARRVFERYVLEALKKWRFRPSDHEHILEITCLFELNSECEGTDKHPITSETNVSAELPTIVHVKTSFPCFEIDMARGK